MSSSPSPLRIAVVGGGIAGLAAAVGILKRKKEGANVDLQVYETASRFGEIGAGVSLGPNAQVTLELLGVGKEMESIAGWAVGAEKDLWFDIYAGDKAHEGQHGGMVTGHQAGTGAVHRADLLDLLIRQIPPDICRFRHRLVSYTPHPSGSRSGVTLTFEDPDIADVEADVLIASDGINSKVRRRIYERKGLEVAKQQAVYSEWVAWRGMIDVARYQEAMKGRRKSVMLLGKGKHILTFPVRRAKTINIVGFVADPERKKLGTHTSNWSEFRPKEEMLEDFADMDDASLALLKEIEKPSIWGIFRAPVLERAVDERVVLIGDAAHAMTPHQGSGAGQAIEDALFISAFLTSDGVLNASKGDRAEKIQSAIELFEEIRHPRSSKVQSTSDEAGQLYEYNGAEKDDVRRITSNLQQRTKWIWEFDVEGELKKALERLNGA
ncbi:hypothetical protein EHS25_001882 [Saitozyma podzolica]|uniref:FAD-binding domain-containing protein n=1 Tax=Saitozyma podzolica TaxID=1890683 RepID=A0A427YFM8_9TREE|nr:hypothetical protein EHS25_001882 [Saitozyma podzolica]